MIMIRATLAVTKSPRHRNGEIHIQTIVKNHRVQVAHVLRGLVADNPPAGPLRIERDGMKILLIEG